MDAFLSRLQQVSSEDPHEDALRIALELGIRAVSADEGSMLALDEAAHDLVFLMTAGDMLSELTLRGQRAPIGHGLTGLAVQSRRTQTGAPVYQSVQQPEHHKLESPRYLVAAPMLVGMRLAGVLTAATYDLERQFSAEQIRLFERIATLAGIVLLERQQTDRF